MASIFWIFTQGDRKNAVFLGTRTTLASACKQASKELCRNIWKNDNMAQIIECKYDSAGNLKHTIRYHVMRSGRISDFIRPSEVDRYSASTDSLMRKFGRQYTVDDFGHLVKRDIEPALYSTVQLW